MTAADLEIVPDALPVPWRESGPGHPLHRVFGRLAERGGRNHYKRALRRILTSIECPIWEPAYRTEPLPITDADLYTYPWEDLGPELADEGLRSIAGAGAYNLAATALRLTIKEYLRTVEDRIEEADDLLEEVAQRPNRAVVAEPLRAERLRLRHQRRGLRLTLDSLDGRRKPLPEEPAGRALSTDELESVYRAAEADRDDLRGRRRAAMLTLLLVVRRFELARLEAADFDPETGRVLVRAGKGGKTATTWVPEQGMPSISRWVESRGTEPGLLLGLSYGAIYEHLTRLAAVAGIGQVTPHDLRRTACTGLLAAGVKPHLVQRQMRHADFGTTQRYDHSRGEEVRRAVARLPVPCAR